MWHSTQWLKLTTLQAKIQSDLSHDYFSLTHDKPKPKWKVELATNENTARLLHFSTAYWTETAQMEDRK